MGMSYNKLWKLLIDKNMRKGDLMKLSGVSPASMSKLAKGENVTTEVLAKICFALLVEPGDIMEMASAETPYKETANETT
ncbi:MAG: helix-turn-helix transcriptional regulator [Clostridiales Family XIII bacterium]|jgi:DNA-binding Xre family transcriptional regulator|nr:helix-turn-helix transcriptional regulator [Clostridiales Family XIII bacterium]